MHATGCITNGSKVHVYGRQGSAALLQAGKHCNVQFVVIPSSIVAPGKPPMQHGHSVLYATS